MPTSVAAGKPAPPSGAAASPARGLASPARGPVDITNRDRDRPASASKSASASRPEEEEGALSNATPPPRKPVSNLAARLREAKALQDAEAAKAATAAEEGVGAEDGARAEEGKESNAKKKKGKPRLEVLDERAIELAQRLDDAMNKIKGGAKARSASDKDAGVEASAKTSSSTSLVVASAASAAAPKQPASSGEKSSWRQLAKATEWKKAKAIKANFPQYFSSRKLNPPQYLLGQFDSPLLKVHALRQWSKLKHHEQTHLKKQFSLMDAYEKALKSWRTKAAKKERNKRGRQERRDTTKRQKRAQPKPTETALPPMVSACLGSEEAAARSASQKQLGVPTKERPRYSVPEKASDLNDKAARGAKAQLNKQFAKTARSITPPPGIDASNWAQSQAMLVYCDTMSDPRRRSGTAKDRNIVSREAARVAKPNVTLCMARGGIDESRVVMEQLLKTGRYDDLVRARHEVIRQHEQQELAPANDGVNLTVADNGDALLAMQEAHLEERAAAEKERSPDDIANDAKVGAMQEQFTFDQLDAEAGAMW